MTPTTSSSRDPTGSAAPATTGTPGIRDASSGAARQTTSSGRASAAAASACSTGMPSRRRTSADAAAPGMARTGRSALTARQPAAPSSPGRRALTVTTRTTGTSSVSGTAARDLLGGCGVGGLVTEDVDHAAVVGHELSVLQDAVARVDPHPDVPADLAHQIVPRLLRRVGRLRLQLGTDLLARRVHRAGDDADHPAAGRGDGHGEPGAGGGRRDVLGQDGGDLVRGTRLQ